MSAGVDSIGSSVSKTHLTSPAMSALSPGTGLGPSEVRCIIAHSPGPDSAVMSEAGEGRGRVMFMYWITITVATAASAAPARLFLILMILLRLIARSSVVATSCPSAAATRFSTPQHPAHHIAPGLLL